MRHSSHLPKQHSRESIQWNKATPLCSQSQSFSKKQLKHLDIPFVLNQQHRAAQEHGTNLKACFLHLNMMSGQTALHPAII